MVKCNEQNNVLVSINKKKQEHVQTEHANGDVIEILVIISP